MDDIIKAKHVLGGLTLGDLKDQIKGLHVFIDGTLYGSTYISGEVFQLWASPLRHGASRNIDLDSPVKLKDGKVILLDRNGLFEETITFGQLAFTEKKIEIPIS